MTTTNAGTEATHCYTIFDADPSSSDAVAWGHRRGVEVIANSDEDAIDLVSSLLARECEGLSASDGYAVGQTIYATVWAQPGGRKIGTVSHTVESVR